MSIGIPTLDPLGGGGVLRVTQFLTEDGTFPNQRVKALYNSQPWSKCYSVKNVLKGVSPPTRKEEKLKNVPGIRFPRYLPESEALSYISNVTIWKEDLNDYEYILGAGGTCLPCLPAALSKLPFRCWVGTTIIDERDAQLHGYSGLKKWRYRIEKPLLVKYEKMIYQRAEKIYSQSKYTKGKIVEHYDINPNKIMKIPFPIDTAKFTMKDDIVDRNNPIIVYVGRTNDPRKNIELLIQSVKKLSFELNDVELRIIGGELPDHLRRLATDLEIYDNIVEYGWVNDIIPHLQEATAFILPSKQEGLGIAALEAMSCGTPVISTYCGGPEDFIRNGRNGFLVNEEPGQIANAVFSVMNTTSLRTNARNTIKNKYDRDIVGDILREEIKEWRPS
ncbi:glycosyltransferase family 4 protein [Halomontanus rarus]|uniref:glycosyltransferase family 4 protein n=1 Tax=Halomontanus rarus TaxID=3034020 RepID=UPI0023E8178D|nr:glycosyltransferase family 4 protein [Halovivax sp. TS33]